MCHDERKLSVEVFIAFTQLHDVAGFALTTLQRSNLQNVFERVFSESQEKSYWENILE